MPTREKQNLRSSSRVCRSPSPVTPDCKTREHGEARLSSRASFAARCLRGSAAVKSTGPQLPGLDPGKVDWPLRLLQVASHLQARCKLAVCRSKSFGCGKAKSSVTHGERRPILGQPIARPMFGLKAILHQDFQIGPPHSLRRPFATWGDVQLGHTISGRYPNGEWNCP